MIDVHFFVKTLVLYEHAGHFFLWFGAFVVTGGRNWSFHILNSEVYKKEQEKLFLLISITLCADSVATYASHDQILCLNNM